MIFIELDNDYEWNQLLSPRGMIINPFSLGVEILVSGTVKIGSLQDLYIVNKYSEILKALFYAVVNKHVSIYVRALNDLYR